MEGRESMWAPVVSEGVEEDELGLSCDIIIKGQPTVLGEDPRVRHSWGIISKETIRALR